MALDRRRTGGQTPCPAYTVTSDIGDFKAGVVLTAWQQRIDLIKAYVPGTKLSDSDLRQIVMDHPENTEDAMTAILDKVEERRDRCR